MRRSSDNLVTCVHCIEKPGNTDDHLVPRSWYPDSTPAGLEKWKFPACESCNNDYSKLENDLLFRFAICLGQNDARAAGIPKRALRSINPNAARNDRDRCERQNRRNRFQTEVQFSAYAPQEGVFPGFGPRPDTEYKEFGSILVAESDLSKMFRKFAKGLTYIENTCYLGSQYTISWYPIDDKSNPQMDKIFSRQGTSHIRGPGVILQRVSVSSDPAQSFMRIALWGRLRVYIAVEEQLKTFDEQEWIVT